MNSKFTFSTIQYSQVSKLTQHDLESVTGIRLLKLALMKRLKNYSKHLSKRIIEGDELYVTLRTWWGPCADFQLFFLY